MIPVIDLGPYLAARPGASTATAAELDRALRDVGFFVATTPRASATWPEPIRHSTPASWSSWAR